MVFCVYVCVTTLGAPLSVNAVQIRNKWFTNLDYSVFNRQILLKTICSKIVSCSCRHEMMKVLFLIIALGKILILLM